jgi:hypothetical protein
VYVVGHNDKGVQFKTLAKAHAIQTVYDQSFHHIALEEMPMLDCTGGDKVQVIGVKVQYP